jgi:hypothetical protein
VSGLGTYLIDVDVTTFLQHASSQDLDVTITSPSGTVVTLTTDNGGTNANVFNGTTWNDKADPNGLVPYDTNDGMVTASGLREQRRGPEPDAGGVARRLHRRGPERHLDAPHLGRYRRQHG